MNSFLLLGFFTSVPLFVKSRNVTVIVCTDGQMQTSFIINPELYAIAMGQIMKVQCKCSTRNNLHNGEFGLLAYILKRILVHLQQLQI